MPKDITVRCGTTIELIATVKGFVPKDPRDDGSAECAQISIAAAIKATMKRDGIVYQSTVRVPLPEVIETALLADDEVYESIMMQAEYQFHEDYKKRMMREED